MAPYTVKKLHRRDIEVDVPASKSILSRALMLAAFSGQDVELEVGEFSQDTCDLLGCLARLGVNIVRGEHTLSIRGGELKRTAVLDVGSAGTAARFLTTMLAFRGGDYSFTASPQMSRRPMEHLSALEEAGVKVEYEEEYGRFPFRMRSAGIDADRMQLDTHTSTQYASGVLLAAALGTHPFTLTLTGDRTEGSYIVMTMRMLSDFGAAYTWRENEIGITPARNVCRRYTVEADVSAACYFYALALLCGMRVTVRGVHLTGLQGDLRFLHLLEEKGVRLTDGQDGLTADGSGIGSFTGFDLNMRDFSDQALTVAALAPFATTPTHIYGIEHIRKQECDRIRAIRENLLALGVPCEEEQDGVKIQPAAVQSGTIRTFGDHRVAMAFSLIGLRQGGVVIDDPSCCKKTFEGFFRILEQLND